jgi:hypothetical protein
MQSEFRVVISVVLLLWVWYHAQVSAQDDLIAKAQNERELVIYGTALVGHLKSSRNLSGVAIRLSRLNIPAPPAKP